MARMNARYAGKCASCGGYFPAGTPIDYSRETRKAAHTECPEVPAAPPAPVPVPEPELAPAEAIKGLLEAAQENMKKYLAGAGAIAKEVEEAVVASYLGKGGCPKCHGKGYTEYYFMDGYGGTDPCRCGAPALDRTAEVEALGLKEKLAESNALAKAALAAQKMVSGLEDRLAIQKGVKVKVVAGRKVKKGTEGMVIWYGSRSVGNPQMKWTMHRENRVGIQDAAGNVHWTAAHNVEVVGVAA